ncbi:P-loop containing nucleoside triphosphate hydrolase protein [Rickenella mellea]|uniref:P-loop containing nucleoside triphosphate hydrolase protein n=1 Tax=Rickenella mellea TaxID=50990 RepID=A0A4Y7Q4P7_9AGAM|nr:P-loop containing nucleoside triphosphate hydrolase protein [Rickenella mellea]
MARPSTTTRMTRSQSTASVLGKRSTSSARSRSPSVSSLKTSSRIPTPDPTPNPKRARTSVADEEDGSNKENIPPFRNATPSTPVEPRATRGLRRSNSDFPVTPTSSRGIRRRAPSVNIPPTPTSSFATLSLSTPPPTPPTITILPLYARARALLRATSNASHSLSMSGREIECAAINSFLRGAEDVDVDMEGDEETVLYISGAPGTGKTALVNSLLETVQKEESARLIFLNCMACSSVDAFWDRLDEELGCDQDVTPSKKPGPRKTKNGKTGAKDRAMAALQACRSRCVLVLDELDHLASSSNANALGPLFALATPQNALRIIGIANTHTLTTSHALPTSLSPENTKHVKTLHFAPYTPPQLLSILSTRLAPLSSDIGDEKDSGKKWDAMFPQPAMKLLAAKVAARTGDVRVLFEVARGAIDRAVAAATLEGKLDVDGQAERKVVVTPPHILAALKAYSPSSSPSTSSTNVKAIGDAKNTNSETATMVRELGLHARLVLLAVLIATRRVSAGLGLNSSSSPPPTPASKRGPIKRTSSSASASLAAGKKSDAGIDATQLHSFYTSLLTETSDARSPVFSAVSRTEFADLLGMLEVKGLVSLSTSTQSGGARPFKRSASFAGKMGSAGPSSQLARLVSDVRASEVLRGLGVHTDAGADAGGNVDVKEEAVRALWARESSRVRREAKARDSFAESSADVVDAFDDAMEG